MEMPEIARLDTFFQRITERFAAPSKASCLVITHVLPERPVFLRALARMTDVVAVLPKPRSVMVQPLAEVRSCHPVYPLSRGLFADPGSALEFLEDRAAEREIVLLDVGGYFAPVLDALVEKFSGRILGVVEDTENGHRRYTSLDRLPCPVFSVARSPLKECEDDLVGRSIVFSTEALVRSRGDILTSRDACVIGYGKVGRSIARTLHAQDLRVTVYDEDPVKRVQALAQGFRVTNSCTEAIRDAGVVLCATGNLALRQADFHSLRNGAYVASVTSSEDELDLASLDGLYRRITVGPHLTRYDVTGHYFYLLADGGAVNFLHGASVGTFIHLIQAEILAATAEIVTGDIPPGLHELSPCRRRIISTVWLDSFTR
ncbi:adenosylhomocysteinase [Embleya sp. NPDC055664]